MIIKANREVLMEKLSAATKLISPKSTFPVLQGIKISVKGKKMVLESTDMESFLKQSMSVESEEDVELVAPKLLYDIVSCFNSDKISISVEGDKLVVKSDSTVFRVNYLPADDFPGFPEPPSKNPFLVDSQALSSNINVVGKAIAKASDQHSKVLTGGLVGFKKDSVKMTATDTYRISMKTIKSTNDVDEDRSVIVPRAALEGVAKLCSGINEKVEVSITDSHIGFKTSGFILSSRLISGHFPKFKNALEREFAFEAIIDRSEMLATLDKMAILSQGDCPVALSFAEKKLTVFIQTVQVGDVTKVTETAYRGGDGVRVRFNPEYLRDGIESVPDSKIMMQVSLDKERPGVIIRGKSDDFTYLLMPTKD